MSSGKARKARQKAQVCDHPPGCYARGIRAFPRPRRCSYCGVRAGRLENDHIVPLIAGGLHCGFNVQPLCPDCHAAKQDADEETGRIRAIAFQWECPPVGIGIAKRGALGARS